MERIPHVQLPRQLCFCFLRNHFLQRHVNVKKTFLAQISTVLKNENLLETSVALVKVFVVEVDICACTRVKIYNFLKMVITSNLPLLVLNKMFMNHMIVLLANRRFFSYFWRAVFSTLCQRGEKFHETNLNFMKLIALYMCNSRGC